MRTGQAPSGRRQRCTPANRQVSRLPTLILLVLLPLAIRIVRTPIGEARGAVQRALDRPSGPKGEACVAGPSGAHRGATGVAVGERPVGEAAIPAGNALAWMHLPGHGPLAATAAAGLLLGAAATPSRRRRRRISPYGLLEAAPVGMAVVSGRDNRLQLANPAFRCALGRPAERLTGYALRDVFPPVIADRAEQCVAEAYRTGRPVHTPELALPGPQDGGVGYWDLECIPVAGPTGRPEAVMMLVTPVTEKVRARQEVEAAARRAEEQAARLQSVLTAISDPVWLFDTGGRPVFANEAAWDFLDLPPGTDLQTLAETMARVETFWADGTRITPEDCPSARALRGERLVGVEVLYRLLSGRPRWGRISAAPLRDPEGRISGAVLIGGDITAQKEAQAERERLLAEVQAAHQRVQAIIDRLPDGVIVLDEQLRVVLANGAAEHCLGGDLEGMSLEEVRQRYRIVTPAGEPIPPEEWPVERWRRGEAVGGQEMRALLPDGRHVDLLVSAGPLPGAEERPAGTIVTLTDITALREAQAERERLMEEVEDARRNLQTILDRLPDCVLVLDTEQRVTLQNETVRRYLGRDVVGRTLPELRREFSFARHPGEPFPPGEEPLARALRGEPVTGVEVCLELPGARHLDLLESTALLREPDGRITGAVVTLTDITALTQARAERERLLRELQAAEENLRTILAQLPDAVVVFDAQMHVSLTNDIVRRFLGYDLVGMTFDDLDRAFQVLTPEGWPLPAEARPSRRAPAGEAIVGMEIMAVVPDGRRTNLLLNLAPLRDAQGRVTGAVLTATDVTALRQAQQERERLLAQVQAARENLRTILDQLPDGVLAFDAGLLVTLSNETIRRYAGREVTGMRAEEVWRALHPLLAGGQPLAPEAAPEQRALRAESVTGMDMSLQMPDGRRIDCLVSAAPLYGPDGKVREVAMVFTEITPLKELDRAKDEFISVAAHELRTPLTSLKGHAQMLLRRAMQARWHSDDQKSLKTIDDQVDRLNDLIGRLLDVSRIRLGRLQIHPAPTDIVALAREVVEDMQVTTPVHQLVLEADQPEIIGNWDPAALRQVLTNLIDNAIKYTPGGPIEVRIRRQDGEVVVSVTDHGPGIPPERRARLFEAFTAGPEEARRAGGLGLGLYISRGIIQAHRGRIWVESELGVGSTFYFSLPLTPERRS